jgi:hypothetical protein
MRRAGNDHEPFFAMELRECHPVQLNHLQVIPANDQQRGRPNTCQGWPSQIGTSAPRHDRAYYVGPLGCRYQRCTGTGTGPEVANAKVSSIGMLR